MNNYSYPKKKQLRNRILRIHKFEKNSALR